MRNNSLMPKLKAKSDDTANALERVLAVEQILKNAARPLSVIDIIRLLELRYDMITTYPSVRRDIDALSHFLYLREDRGKFWIDRSL